LKRPPLIIETLPGIGCVTHLINPANPASISAARAIDAEKSLGVESKWIELADAGQLNQFLATPLDPHFEKALMSTGDALFWAHRLEIADAAVRRESLCPDRTDYEGGWSNYSTGRSCRALTR
jgi:hypothetical protein